MLQPGRWAGAPGAAGTCPFCLGVGRAGPGSRRGWWRRRRAGRGARRCASRAPSGDQVCVQERPARSLIVCAPEDGTRCAGQGAGEWVSEYVCGSQVPSGATRQPHGRMSTCSAQRLRRGNGLFLLVGAHAQPCPAPQKRLLWRTRFARRRCWFGREVRVGDGAHEGFHSARPPPSAPVNVCPRSGAHAPSGPSAGCSVKTF